VIRVPPIQWNVKRTKCKEAISCVIVPRRRVAGGFVGLRELFGYLEIEASSPKVSIQNGCQSGVRDFYVA
jgi:hypothetical protein